MPNPVAERSAVIVTAPSVAALGVKSINVPSVVVIVSTILVGNVGIEGKVWTRGYDVRFCFDEEALKQKIDYVQRHGD